MSPSGPPSPTKTTKGVSISHMFKCVSVVNIQGFLVAKQPQKYGVLNTKDSFEFFELFNGGDGSLFLPLKNQERGKDLV